jgi:hypothetical protein
MYQTGTGGAVDAPRRHMIVARANPAEPSATPIRPFRRQDVDAVATIFQKSFRADGDEAPAATLTDYLHELFFADGNDEESPSRVYLATDGSIVGFVGAIPLPMSLRGKPLRALVPTAFMVDRATEFPFAGIGLLRSLLSGPQDVTLSDTASMLVRQIWGRFGGISPDAYSLDWWRVLRPASFATFLLTRNQSIPRPLSRLMSFGADRVLERVRRNRYRVELDKAAPRSETVSEDEFTEHFQALTQRFALRPDWEGDALTWRLSHAARRNSHGPFIRRVVFGRGNRPIGAYLFNARSGGVAHVLDLVAAPSAHAAVLNDLLVQAQSLGAIAVRGRSQPEFTEALVQNNSFFTRRLSTLVNARDPDVLAAVQSGNAMITGLAGDTWTRLFDDDFS